MTSPSVHPSQPLSPLTLAEAASEPVKSPASSTGLLEQLAQTLDREGIRYCQWKGHWSAHRWSRGYGDVDLLVDHDAVAGFRTIMGQLGFKLAQPEGERQIPGVEHYFGYDPQVRRLLHLHVHYRLLLGEYWKRIYRIPIEHHILEQSVPGQPFRVPIPTHTFLIFVLRIMLRQVGRPWLSAHDRWLSGIRVPLAALEAASDSRELAHLLEQQLSPIDLPFFSRCVRSLEGQSGRGTRVILPWLLHLKLRPHVRMPPVSSVTNALLEKCLPSAISGRLLDPRMRPSGGGLVVALIGGDGSGKSTCTRELHSWLAPQFPAMRAHLGNPPRSLVTLVAGAVLQLSQSVERRLGRSPRPGSYIELFRHLCTARDRYRLYQKARRFAVAGGIALCERYPVPPNYVHVEPVIPQLLPDQASRLAQWLRQAEASYYRRILPPDVLFVLKLDPELAVLRKPDEPADYVRTRGRTICETDWSGTRAHLVDAGRPLPDVLRQLKATIWSLL